MVERREKSLGADDYSTLAAVDMLGTLLQEMSKFDESEVYRRRSIEGMMATKGEDHPETLGMMSTLGYLLQSKGNLVEAEVHYASALEGFERVFGWNHQYTKIATNNLNKLRDRIEKDRVLKEKEDRVLKDKEKKKKR